MAGFQVSTEDPCQLTPFPKWLCHDGKQNSLASGTDHRDWNRPARLRNECSSQ